ncbi:MAG: DUF1592 domain-containing protein [Prosthecobacter sp.]|jgi:hypothetical protein|uniref:DUF1592 domain-containing protein n=1 Tax=Prosthecobacter sp. TaxID=1965333 RepID=UPI0019F0F4F4|nr:DUF1592 domain-containing protein [Prosthecobacter sp.]MBE2284486.1 DUF1592 domain-containing protein [Prosthecobacter sp.]
MHRLWLIFLFPPVTFAAIPAIQPFLDQNCMDCHDAEMKKGGLDLAALPTDGSDAAALKKWVRVFDRVAAGEMPPPKKKQPSQDAVQDFMGALGADLVVKSNAQKGTVLRRLNRREYQNTINDLLGVKVNIIDALPEDGRALGFDNIGEALSISGIQMQRYMEVAETALNTALYADAKPEKTTQTATLESDRNKDNIGKHWLKRDDGAIVVFNNGGFPSTVIPNLRAKAAGTYKLRVTGYGYQIEEPAVFALITGSFNFRNADNVTHSFHELPADKAGTVEITLHLDANKGIWISPQGLNGPDGHSPVKDGPANYPGEGLALLSVELAGPFIDAWPPRGQKMLLGDAKLRELMPDKPWMRGKAGYKPVFTADSADPTADARKLLPPFAQAAFRRPVTASEVEPFVKLFDAEFAEGKDFLAAMRTAAIAVLCSPEFLYLKEPAGRLDDLQIASRLSYFLTRGTPDAELLAAKLTQPAVLRAQTERLLKADTLERFVTDFTDGWLNLREIEFTTPDKQLYPEYDELLLDSMLRETRGFFTELIQNNLSAANIVQSDFAMLDARLARHYGIPGVAGMELRKVKLPADSHRGGVLTQASVMKVSANGTNTSPVVRGIFVMDRILGLEPPPPPPGVPGVEPDIRGATTLRELLDKHRNTESCNGCHKVIDAPGFALENYDVIGGWRDRFRSIDKGDQVSLKIEGRKVRYRLGPPVDAAGELPDGREFASFAELQKLLVADQDRVARCIIEKLLVFATGRPMGFSDRAELDHILTASKAKGHGMRDLLHAVVQSEVFRNK